MRCGIDEADYYLILRDKDHIIILTILISTFILVCPYKRIFFEKWWVLPIVLGYFI